MKTPTSPDATHACTLVAIGFDFKTRTEAPLPPEQAAEAIAQGRCVWLDVDLGSPSNSADPTPPDLDGARRVLESLGLIDAEALEDALSFEPSTQQARHAGGLHFALCGCRLEDDGLALQPLNVYVGHNLVVTLHRGPVDFLDALHRDYHDDFVEHAQSFGFLVYELWDHLIENYLHTQQRFEERVVDLQGRLMGKVDEAVFTSVSRLGADLLRLRGLLLPARGTLTELATRKSAFIPDTTRPYLRDMTHALEHILQDVMVDRDILSETLNLSMSMMTHRTNQVVTSLTAVSVIFLPLTFLCGVYGMNFLNLPEIKWVYGYALFWMVCAVIVIAGLFVLKKKKMM